MTNKELQKRLMSYIDNGQINNLTTGQIRYAHTLMEKKYHKWYFQTKQTIEDVNLTLVWAGYKDTKHRYEFNLVIAGAKCQGCEAVASMPRAMSYYLDAFRRNGNLAIRKYIHAYNAPYDCLLDDCGFDLDNHSIRKHKTDCAIYVKNNARCGNNYSVIELIDTPQAETLYKVGYHSLLNCIINSRSYMLTNKLYWQCIKVMMRNHYKCNDWLMWLDYVEMLQKNGKDIRNAHYICPENLLHSHDWINRIDTKRLEKEARERAYKDALSHEERYNQTHKMFFGIGFNDGKHLFLHTIDNVADLILEGKAMHHCVGGYWSHDDALIFSCRDENGIRLATIEVNLKTLQVIQIRALQNKQPKDYCAIKKLVENNIELIEERKVA